MNRASPTVRFAKNVLDARDEIDRQTVLLANFDPVECYMLLAGDGITALQMSVAVSHLIRSQPNSEDLESLVRLLELRDVIDEQLQH